MEIDIGIGKVVTPDGNGINDKWILTNIENSRIIRCPCRSMGWGLIFTSSRYNNEM